MLLKINKEGPYKKDVFRAPGHQGNTRKLIHFLQQGKMVFFVRNSIIGIFMVKFIYSEKATKFCEIFT